MVDRNPSKPAARLNVDGSTFLCVAMNSSSPTGNFRDSAGYAILQQRAYALQLQAAKEMDAKLHASSTKDYATDAKSN